MAVILPKKTRKVTVRKSRVPQNPDFYCRICGNTKEVELTYSYRDSNGNRQKIVTCKSYSTCAGYVSLFGAVKKGR